jgi:hypothetical protein
MPTPTPSPQVEFIPNDKSELEIKSPINEENNDKNENRPSNCSSIQFIDQSITQHNTTNTTLINDNETDVETQEIVIEKPVDELLIDPSSLQQNGSTCNKVSLGKRLFEKQKQNVLNLIQTTTDHENTAGSVNNAFIMDQDQILEDETIFIETTTTATHDPFTKPALPPRIDKIKLDIPSNDNINKTPIASFVVSSTHSISTDKISSYKSNIDDNKNEDGAITSTTSIDTNGSSNANQFCKTLGN